MDYLIVGQGHLIIGYPDETEVKIEDDRGVLRSYRYEPYISAEIVNSETARGLFDVLTLATPNAPFKPFQGPSGAEIHAFQTAGSDVIVKFNWGVDQESRVRKTPIELKDSYIAQK